MLHSVRARLLWTVGLVVVAALAAVGFLTARITRTEFDRFLAIQLRADHLVPPDSLRSVLRRYHERRGSWEGVQEVLAGVVGDSALVTTRFVAVAADSCRIVPPFAAPGDSRAGCPPESVLALAFSLAEEKTAGRRETIVVRAGGAIVDEAAPKAAAGAAAGAGAGLTTVPAAGVVALSSQGAALSPPRRQFLLSTSRGVLGAVLAAGLLALASTALLARRLLRPVEELTAIAREMGGGDLGRRAVVRSRDEIGELARTFNDMADGLQRIERLRRNTVDDVAHELRTPLTNIRGQLEALQDGLLSPDRAVIDSLHQETLLLQRIVDDLQELALAEAGQLRLEPQVLALRDEVERAAQPLFAGPAAPAGPTLSLAIAPDLTVRADPVRLGQILRNLLQNALAHTPPGGVVTVAAEAAGTGADGGGAAGTVEVVVRDSGAGISAADLPLIFERFYRGDRSRARATGGAGLGLTIARQLVQAHGGAIRAESRPGEGAAFHFTLPRGER
jgi:signal transduction histidine kinase